MDGLHLPQPLQPPRPPFPHPQTHVSLRVAGKEKVTVSLPFLAGGLNKLLFGQNKFGK